MTDPSLPWVTAVTVRVSPSSTPSLSLASTSTALSRLSSATITSSLVAIGSSLTLVTVIVKVRVVLVSAPPFAIPPLSWILTDTVATPYAFVAGV